MGPGGSTGMGLIPAKLEPGTNRPLLDKNGNPELDYDLAIPQMLLHYFPTGMLGLGLTALLASFMSGMAGHVYAFYTMWSPANFLIHLPPPAVRPPHLLHVSLADAGWI